MYRRRVRTREIPFSFDSFLDVVANVVGVIIRLILVVWVGARSYTGQEAEAPTAASDPITQQVRLEDPLENELARRRRELEELQARLGKQLDHLHLAERATEQTQRQLAALAASREQVSEEAERLDRVSARGGEATEAVVLSSRELRERGKLLAKQVLELEKLPPAKQALRYRTPVSRPVQADELFFECRGGRVTFVELAALLEEVRRDMKERRDTLKLQWQVEGRTSVIGAFRFHYLIERERGMLDVFGPTARPDPGAAFSLALSAGELEPVTASRGEDLRTALTPGSEFRQIVDVIDPRQMTVTFWVYPDSFAMYRQLRDYLYERDVTVAGRPLPDGALIGCSRQGSISRGQ